MSLYGITIKDLGDITGRTLVVRCPSNISSSIIDQISSQMNSAMPEAQHIIVAGDGVDICLNDESPIWAIDAGRD